MADPPVGRTSVHSILIVVDFPAPFGPRNPKVSPRRTSNDTPPTASISPYVLRRSRTSTAAPCGAAAASGEGVPIRESVMAKHYGELREMPSEDSRRSYERRAA